MSNRDFYPMFMAAWEASFKKDTILKAFEATGLSPFEPEVILKRFNEPAQSGQLSNSDSSALSTSDWKKIRQLVDYAVANRDKRNISKPNQTIHQLSIRSVLAEHEDLRLKEALINERQLKSITVALYSGLQGRRRWYMIARSISSVRRSNNNTKELRQLAYVRIKSRISYRQFQRGV
jgi:hypothetical protein